MDFGRPCNGLILGSTCIYFYAYVYFSGDFSCSFFKLRLKFVRTTRVVCKNFAEC